MYVVVQRPFKGPNGPMVSGQLEDASGWQWLSKLIDQKYVRPATDAEIASAQEVEVEKPRPARAKKIKLKRT